MKTRLKTTAYFGILIILFNSCTKPYTIDLNDINKRMVVNGIFCEDSIFRIELLEEATLSENTDPTIGFKPINNALIQIAKDGQITDTLIQESEGIYTGNFYADKTTTYQIFAKATNYPDATAENKVPTKVKIDTLTSELVSSSEGTFYSIKIKFTDPEAEKNYYTLQLNNSIMFISFESDDASFNNYSSGNFMVPQFNDELFNGQSYEITIHISTNAPNRYDSDKPFILVSLISVSQDIYKYVDSYNQQQTTAEDEALDYFLQGLIQPAPIYTNVTGGLGLFAGYTFDQDTLFFEE